MGPQVVLDDLFSNDDKLNFRPKRRANNSVATNRGVPSLFSMKGRPSATKSFFGLFSERPKTKKELEMEVLALKFEKELTYINESFYDFSYTMPQLPKMTFDNLVQGGVRPGQKVQSIVSHTTSNVVATTSFSPTGDNNPNSPNTPPTSHKPSVIAFNILYGAGNSRLKPPSALREEISRPSRPSINGDPLHAVDQSSAKSDTVKKVAMPVLVTQKNKASHSASNESSNILSIIITDPAKANLDPCKLIEGSVILSQQPNVPNLSILKMSEDDPLLIPEDVMKSLGIEVIIDLPRIASRRSVNRQIQVEEMLKLEPQRPVSRNSQLRKSPSAEEQFLRPRPSSVRRISLRQASDLQSIVEMPQEIVLKFPECKAQAQNQILSLPHISQKTDDLNSINQFTRGPHIAP